MNMFSVGKIINTHGIQGEVKVKRISDFDERFNVGETLYAVEENENPIPLVIDGHRNHKGFELMHFKGYDSINDVAPFKGMYLKITEKQLTELEEGEYYYHEIIGNTVFTDTGEKIGEISEILSPGANDVWVVKQEIGKDILIPYIDDVVIEVDVPAKKVIIKPMEGLFD
ncbi:ribosome maturation factor RimM [Virgibacillus alimentarius]|uniref:Ribosome maturation factor RimM n=1 Tax=Virgibacillus alimentarius TaxID=698769 RepID=A0ABS4S5A5_9BACI|nr:ribosome maturation factor RimM [Virgibacillus alimentarius]MBP2256175.1 16S rRNA processing protein RimM [Virgibacillus alimentarius]